MELLESDLRSVIYGGKHIPPELCAQMMLQVSSALIYMHNLGLLHRDIKPANIFVTDLKIIKVGVFGATMEDSPEADVGIAGTPEYMPFEIWNAAELASLVWLFIFLVLSDQT